jgi:hypothetical protein
VNAEISHRIKSNGQNCIPTNAKPGINTEASAPRLGAANDDRIVASWYGSDLQGQLLAINRDLVTAMRERALDYEANKPARTAASAQVLLRNRAAWAALDATAVAHMAACPVSLFDVQLANSAGWRLLAERRVAEPQPVQRAISAQPWLSPQAAERLARMALHLAWHLSRHRPLAAALALGMSPTTAAALRELQLGDLESLLLSRPHWFAPRWCDDADIWAELLQSALSGDAVQLECARASALQLLARELAKPRGSAS